MPDIVLFILLFLGVIGTFLTSSFKLVDYNDGKSQSVPLLFYVPLVVITCGLAIWTSIAVNMPLAVEQERLLDVQTVHVNGLKTQVAPYTDEQNQVQHLNVTKIFNAMLPDNCKVKMIKYKKYYAGVLFTSIQNKYEIVP